MLIDWAMQLVRSEVEKFMGLPEPRDPRCRAMEDYKLLLADAHRDAIQIFKNSSNTEGETG